MIPRKPIALIVNPNAGKKQGSRIADYAIRRLREAGLSVEQMISTRPGGTRTIAESLEPKEWSSIVTVGGDGSLFEVLNGLYKKGYNIPSIIGLIPSGTGNSFLRDTNIYNPEDAIAAIVANKTSFVDLGHFSIADGEFQFINIVGAGFVANVAKRASKYKFLGAKSYLFALMEEVIRLKSYPIHLEIDGCTREREAIFVEICNSRFTGGNMLMAPSASLNDGLLDVVVLSRCSRKRLLQHLPTIFSGKHIEAAEVEVFRGSHIVLKSEQTMALNPDGEVFGSTPIHFGIEQRFLQIFTG